MAAEDRNVRSRHAWRRLFVRPDLVSVRLFWR